MIDWIAAVGFIWICLVTAVIFLALSRTLAAMRDRKLTRKGLGAAVHLHLRHVIQAEDRAGITLCAESLSKR
jgi:hypothetical protein